MSRLPVPDGDGVSLAGDGLAGQIGRRNLRLRGLMCIAPNYDDVEKCRPLFHEMYEIFQQVKEIPFKTANISYLSMGMTHDYQIAVEEGANIVRVGTAIFGPRQY